MVTGLGKTATASKSRKKLQRCQHGLLKGTCAICLRMDETVELHTGKLAPEERPGGKAHPEDEEPAEEEE